MPGIAVFGKLFFKKKRGREKRPSAIPSDTLATACARRLLVVGKIIRRKPRRGREHLVTVNENAPVAPRRELAFVRVRRDDPGATGWHAVNQSSVGRNPHHSSAHWTNATLRRRRSGPLFALGTRLASSGRLRSFIRWQ